VTRDALEQDMRRTIELWQSERDALAKEKETRLREKFYQAHRSGHSYLAWKLARTHMGGMGGGVKTATTTAIDRAAWEGHFSRLFQNLAAEDLGRVDVGHRVVNFLNRPVTTGEVERALEQKRNLRAPGPDGFRVDFLRYVHYNEVVCQAVANFFNVIMQNSEVPLTWNEAFLFVLYKGKGDKVDPNSYRGITLKSHFLKLLETVICNRFLSWIDEHELLPVEQLSYRRQLSGTDHLFLLNVLKEDAILTGKKLFVGFIDLQKAFPSVHRKKLILDLVDAGVSARTVQLFRRLYTGDTFCLLLKGVCGHLVFCVVQGVHEGSCLSPILFIFFIRELPARLNMLPVDSPVIGGKKLSSLLFADDLTLLPYSVNGTQALVVEAEAFFAEKGLNPNPAKCEFLAFQQPATGRRRRWTKAVWRVRDVRREEQE
jgi:hypothetical protein